MASPGPAGGKLEGRCDSLIWNRLHLMVLVDTGRFLNELGRLFEKAKAKDSVSITLKRSKLLELALHTGLQQISSFRTSARGIPDHVHGYVCRQSKA